MATFGTLIPKPGIYYTKPEVAVLLGVSAVAVYKYLTRQTKTKWLDGIRTSGHGWLIHQDTLNEFAKQHDIKLATI